MNIQSPNKQALIDAEKARHERELISIDKFCQWIEDHKTERYHGNSVIFEMDGNDYVCTSYAPAITYLQLRSIKSNVTPSTPEIRGYAL